MNIKDIPLAQIVMGAFENINGPMPMSYAYRKMVVHKARFSSLWPTKKYEHSQEELVKTLLRILWNYRRNNSVNSMNLLNITFFSHLLKLLGLVKLVKIAKPDLSVCKNSEKKGIESLLEDIWIPKSMIKFSNINKYKPFIRHTNEGSGESGIALLLEQENPLHNELDNHCSLEGLISLLNETGYVITNQTLRMLKLSDSLRKITLITPYRGVIHSPPRLLSEHEKKFLIKVMGRLSEIYENL